MARRARFYAASITVIIAESRQLNRVGHGAIAANVGVDVIAAVVVGTQADAYRNACRTAGISIA